MITSVSSKLIEKVTQGLKSAYGTISVHDGLIHSYLGMTFDFSQLGKVKLSMGKYVTDLIKDCEVTGSAETPAGVDLFTVDNSSPKLEEAKRVQFHSRIAKILYLAKRTRPDLLTSCTFLAGRVTVATAQDLRKLNRLLRYINSIVDLGLNIDMTEGMCINAFIDASYGVHLDGKSHSGAVIMLGRRGLIFAKSSKQKIVTKSSTEAELVALSDNLSQVIWTRDFLADQGYHMAAARVYQDNMSTIALAEKGRSTAERTRHINIRYFFVKDRVEAGEIKIEYCPTKDMLADVLTNLFCELRDQLLNA